MHYPKAASEMVSLERNWIMFKKYKNLPKEYNIEPILQQTSVASLATLSLVYRVAGSELAIFECVTYIYLEKLETTNCKYEGKMLTLQGTPKSCMWFCH